MSKWRLFAILGVALILTLPTAASAASSQIDDVPDDSIFVDDINWMKDTAISMGGNPPLNANR